MKHLTQKAVVTRTTGVLLAVGMVLGACSTGTNAGNGVDNAAGPPAPVDCEPTYPPHLQGAQSYYAVVMQLMNCQSEDQPLMMDLDLRAGQGTSLKDIGGLDAVGTSVVWDNGSGAPQSPAAAVPKGDGQGGYGKMVGFTTVPRWNGKKGDSPGPYDATENDDKKTLDPNFFGNWTVYSPSSMLQLDVFTSMPWAYTPDYFQSDDPAKDPGALATGTFLTRSQLGGGQVPIFTKSSQQGNGASPPESSFFPGTCWDPLVLMNGANPDPAVPSMSPIPKPTSLYNPSDWSFLIKDTNNSWTATLAGNDYLPLSNVFASPAVMLTNGWVATNGGQNQEIALRNDLNGDQSRLPHYVKAYYRVMKNQKCSGSTAEVKNAVAIGTDLSTMDFSFAKAGNAVFANSSLKDANLTATSFVGQQDASLAFADLTNANLAGAVLQEANLTGANLTGANAEKLNLTGAKLLMTNLSNVQNWDQVTQAGTLYCQTTPPGATEPDNSDCATLLKSQDADWDNVSTSDCVPSSCGFVSVYNNTTRTLAKGFNQCLVGEERVINGQYAPAFIAPLDTAKWAWEIKPGQDPEDNDGKNVIHCGLTYANGVSGKIQLVAQTDGKNPVAMTAADGTCLQAGSCLPKSADGKTPVTVSVSKESRADGTFYDVIICEADKAVAGVCPKDPALPGLQPVAKPSNKSTDK